MSAPSSTGSSTTNVTGIDSHRELRAAREELRYWRTHLRLAYENEWHDVCVATAKNEIKRLREIVEPSTIIDKIADLKN